MDAQYLYPHPSLRLFIRHYVYSEIGTAGIWSQSSMAPPGCAKLSIALKTDQIIVKENKSNPSNYGPITFVGQTTQYKQLAWRDHLNLFIIIFQPYGAYPLLGIHQQECQNLCLGSSEIPNKNIYDLQARLTKKNKTTSYKNIVDRFFLKKLTHFGKWDEKNKEESIRLSHAMKRISLYSCQKITIKTLCRKTGYSISTLERHMKKIVGMTPKQYQRIVRFNKVMQYIKQTPSPLNWPRIARRFGYYDQTHFIKEFKHFYGKTPAKYTSEDNRFLSNVALQKKKLVNI